MSGALVVGSVELVPLVDAVGLLGELDELFPGFDDWEPYRTLYPELFDGSQWRISCTSYLLRSGGTTVLVDTGVGPAGLWGWTPEWEEGLLPALAGAGCRAGRDRHRLPDAPARRSRRLEHGPERRARLSESALRRAPRRQSRSRARPTGRTSPARSRRSTFEEIGGETELAEGVTAFELPGHFPGHMGLRIASGGRAAVLIADAAVHPMLLHEPGGEYVSDLDRAESVATRRALVPELLRDEGLVVVCGHYPGGGIGRVTSRDGRIVWEVL